MSGLKERTFYSLSQLSRAEKALVAVSFIFAIYKNYKIPFIMIDQIENELETIDNTRVAQFLKLAASQMQVVIVSTGLNYSRKVWLFIKP